MSYQVSIRQSCEQCSSYIWPMEKACLCSSKWSALLLCFGFRKARVLATVAGADKQGLTGSWLDWRQRQAEPYAVRGQVQAAVTVGSSNSFQPLQWSNSRALNATACCFCFCGKRLCGEGDLGEIRKETYHFHVAMVYPASAAMKLRVICHFSYKDEGVV